MSIVNRKKVRGWRRQIEKVDRWRQQNIELNIVDRSYVKIWIDPWYRLQRRNPPLWLARYMLAGLIEIYDAWHSQLTARGEDFYLKIWLFDRHFISSQVVAAIDSSRDYYQHTFLPVSPVPATKLQPSSLYRSSSLFNLDRFNWQYCQDEMVYAERADELTRSEIDRLHTTAMRIWQSSDGDTLYSTVIDRLWVGERNK
jgi:hypothetical protein